MKHVIKFILMLICFTMANAAQNPNLSKFSLMHNGSSLSKNSLPGVTQRDSSVYATFADSSGLFARTLYGFVWQYVSGTWTQLTSGAGGGALDGTFITVLGRNSSGDLFAGTHGVADGSGNDGLVFKYHSGTWVSVNGSGSAGSLDSTSITAMKI